MADTSNNSTSSNISLPADAPTTENSNKSSNHVKLTPTKTMTGGGTTPGSNSTKIRIPSHKNGATNTSSSNTKITLRMPPKLKPNNKDEGSSATSSNEENSQSRSSNPSLKLHLKTSPNEKKSHDHVDNKNNSITSKNINHDKSVSSNSSASFSHQNSPTHPPSYGEKEPSDAAPQEEDETMMEEDESVLSNNPKKKSGDDALSSKPERSNQDSSLHLPSSQASSNPEGENPTANASNKSTISTTPPVEDNSSNKDNTNSTAFRGPSLRDGAGMLSTPSFLDTLNEEERRVRTRHIPSAQGFRKLYKGEIKRDLVIARYFRNSRNKHNASNAEDDSSDHASDAAKSNNKSSHSKAITDPSGLFVPPIADSVYIYTKDNDDSISGSTPNKKKDLYLRSPWVVDSMAAHSPPRPPESVGQKKKNRLARWEAHPELVDAELDNYRKTVSRTREELEKVEMEKERIQVLGCHVRNHYREHTKAIVEETQQLEQTLQQLLTACLSSTSTSTTSKSTDELMKEAISAFYHRNRPSQTAPSLSNIPTLPTTPGMGGVTMSQSSSCVDDEIPLANAWSLPNDKVLTPYGLGTIYQLFGPSKLDVSVPPLSIQTPSPQPQNPVWTPHGFGGASPKKKSTLPTNNSSSLEMVLNKNSNTNNKSQTSKSNPLSKDCTSTSGNKKNSSRNKTKLHKKIKKDNDSNKTTVEENIILLPPRICVKLPFGIGYFSPKDVISKENPSEYSNGEFVTRWKAMIESAQSMKYSMDTVAMSFLSKKKIESYDNKMEIEEESRSKKSSHTSNNQSSSSSLGKPPNSPLQSDSKNSDHSMVNGEPKSLNPKHIKDATNKNSKKRPITPIRKHRVIPFGSNLMNPSMASWALATMNMQTIENNLKSMPLNPCPNLGSEHNHHVPARLHEMENQKLDFYKKKGRVLQLQNEIFRQRRLRMLNERSVAAEEERSERCEILLAEMKADLTSLKERLNDELVELGIDQEKAEELLSEQLRLEQEDLEAYNDELLPDSTKQKDDSEEEDDEIEEEEDNDDVDDDDDDDDDDEEEEEEEEEEEDNMFPSTSHEEHVNHDHDEIIEDSREIVTTSSTHEDRDEGNVNSMIGVSEEIHNSESNNDSRQSKRRRDDIDDSITDEDTRPPKLRQ